MKDAYFFSHDSNAQYDEKISMLRLKHGWAGYGIFWAIIEKLRDSTNYRWSSQAEAGLKHGLSDAQTTLEQIGEVVETMKKVGLLTVSDDGYLYSQSLTRRMESWNNKRIALSDAGRKGGKKSVESRLSEAQARLKPGSSQASSQVQAIRVDKSKEYKSINNIHHSEKNKHLDCVLLTKDEFSKLTESFGIEGTNQRIQNLNDYIMSKGVKYKSHYHTILNWERKNGHGKAGTGFPGGKQPLACEKDTSPDPYDIVGEIIYVDNANTKDIG